ncbi:MAG: hypothetical protein PSV24_11065 [Rhodoferax sp.]|nr:hypothetical protein [Rhodoferax sp.]
MLIYSSRFHLEPKNGPQQIVDCIARWMGRRAGGYVEGKQLAQGINQRLRDGSTALSRATFDSASEPTYPLLFCAQLSHADKDVGGRRWFSEVGLRQVERQGPIECTILLRTDEISPRVTAPIQVTRPLIVQTLMETCEPSGDTPGLRVKRLDETSAAAFLMEVEREARRHTMVVVSPNRDGVFAVQPERLRSLLVGIAEVVEVPAGVDTFKIEEIVGGRYGAWGGAINVLFQARTGDRGIYCDRTLYRPADIAALTAEGKNLDSEILATVTHRTNLPYSWKHISLEVVSQAALRSQLAASIHRAKNSDEANEYAALLEEADKELLAKDNEVATLRQDLEDKASLAYRLQSDIDSLKHALNGRQSSGDTSEDELAAIRPLRDAVASLIGGEPSLEQSLTIISTFFPDRVVVLDSAYESAQDSKEFMFRKSAFDLLWSFVNDYWSALDGGQGDMIGKRAFGANSFAQNEGQALTQMGKRRRTFTYRSTDILMEKHLKIGVKDSVAETLRIHFEWINVERRLVIGHCGKHLDF